jgi:glycosyltransferase involved in cell wall biosynthesis
LPNLRSSGGPRHGLERFWWSWGLDRELSRQKTELFHGTNFEVPLLARRPSVLTLHDLSPWLDPSWHRHADRVRRRAPSLIRLGVATMIITPTEAIRRKAMEIFRIHPNRIVAVPHGGVPQAWAPVPPAREAPYFLCVGTLEPRKNLAGVIEAWRAVWQRCRVELRLAGRRRADFSGPAPEEGLRMLGEVSERELAQLYSGALALIYFSHHEGFGLPVLEAMQCGACVVISRDPALREVAGDAAFQPGSARELTEVMMLLATRPERLQQWRERSLRRGAEFSWGLTARLTRTVYDEARKRFPEV